MRALVVDNDDSMQKLVLRLLDREGWTGITAADDREAFAAFMVGWFDVAIIDVDLDAGSDGIELAKILRKLDPALPIVMISGDSFNAARVKKARLHHFFAKPFQIESISSVLRTIAPRT